MLFLFLLQHLQLPVQLSAIFGFRTGHSHDSGISLNLVSGVFGFFLGWEGLTTTGVVVTVDKPSMFFARLIQATVEKSSAAFCFFPSVAAVSTTRAGLDEMRRRIDGEPQNHPHT